MPRKGWSRPVRHAAIAGAITLTAGIAIIVGIVIMEAQGGESTLSAALIGLGLFVFIMGCAVTFILVWSARVIARMRRGEGLLTRWTVSREELDRFRTADAARSAHGPEYVSMWVPPKISPEEGLEVLVSPDAVLMGEDYVGLSTTGMQRFSAMKRIANAPASLEFLIHMSEPRGATVQRMVSLTKLLRVPTSASAPEAADTMQGHFERVLRREIIVNPHWWTVRIRIGLWAMGIGLAAALGGWAWPKFFADPDYIGQAVSGVGILVALGGLAVAYMASILRRAQMRR